jgi:glycosyltransferase involved in cell wall biosynthesis
MERNPVVSVVVIFLNAKPFIEEAITSVFVQTYDTWELLLVDDGSSDGSTAIAQRYAERCPGKVRYLTHEGHRNRGMSASRNLGIRHATGAYIAFLDADDAWLANTLEEQVAILEAHTDAAIVYGPIQWWYSWTGRPEDSERDYVENLGVSPNTLIMPPTLLPLFLMDKAAVPSGILARRDAIERIGAFEDAFRGEYEDQVFCAKICLNAPVFASSKSWYKYRQHPDSCVSVGYITGRTHGARQMFLNWLAAYISAQGINDSAVRQVLRHELRPYRHPVLHRLEIQIGRIVQQMGRLGKPDGVEVRSP